MGKRVPLMSLSSQTNPCVNKTSCTTYGYFLFSTLWPNHWIGVKEASVHCGTFEVACKLLSTHFMSPRMCIYIYKDTFPFSPTQTHQQGSGTQNPRKKGKSHKKYLTMSSTVIDIPVKEGEIYLNKKKKIQFPLLLNVSSLIEKACKDYDMRKVMHSIKVGIALVLVSLLYLLDPLFKKVGENAMWAIMTVVVVFEFYAGLSLHLFTVVLSINSVPNLK